MKSSFRLKYGRWDEYSIEIYQLYPKFLKVEICRKRPDYCILEYEYENAIILQGDEKYRLDIFFSKVPVLLKKDRIRLVEFLKFKFIDMDIDTELYRDKLNDPNRIVEYATQLSNILNSYI